ncbi:hypothetical protein KIN20_021161 [Parelaphostrongylus tenuis]|uniref:C2H2-type domain-containing protein n=1 Tax=Parelaphostrongylus tenuis TaxID=148309 RepID=A0AAD5QRD4_PARTN|nr:hypothetical protein KIN20_021161 [Parelaphostrongylus tenuis]
MPAPLRERCRLRKTQREKRCELIERTDGIGESVERTVERELNEKCGNTNASGNLVPLAKQVKEEEDEEKENANGGERLVLFEETVKQEDIGRSEDLDGTGERAVDTEEGEENLAHMRELVKKKGHRKMMLRDKRKEKEQKMKMLRQRRREKKRERELKRQAAIKNKKLQLFCCYVCNRVFSEEDAMKKHLLDKHIGYEKEYILKCDQCYRRFKLKQHLRRHEETHKNTSYACPHCKREFRKEISLEIHLSKVHGRTLDGTKISKTLGCGCGQKFGLKEEFARHRYYCVNREKIFEQRRKARQELEAAARSSVNSTQPASSCPNTASTSSAPGRPLKDKSCPFCFHVYASMQSRRRHIRQIHPERLHDDEVDQHLYIKVNSPSLPYVCEVCAKMFASHASLSTHKRRKHEDLNIHECSVCQKRYPLPSELRKHLKRVHGVQSEV